MQGNTHVLKRNTVAKSSKITVNLIKTLQLLLQSNLGDVVSTDSLLRFCPGSCWGVGTSARIQNARCSSCSSCMPECIRL